jgi:hypothetical protein
MPEYQFLGEKNAVTYDAFGYTVMKKYVDVAILVANPQMLALASAPNTPLSSFTGFSGSAGAVLNVFHVPAGAIVTKMGLYIQAADTATTTTIALGDGDSTAGFMAAEALDGDGHTMTIVTDAYGTDNVCGVAYEADDTLDALFAVATSIDAKLHFWAEVFKGFDITSVV